MVQNNKTQEMIYEKCSQESNEFLQSFSNISSKLIKIKLDKEYLIEECLEEIGEKTDSSRAYIFLFRDDFKYMDNVYEWCAKGVSAEKNNLQNLKTDFFSWWLKNLRLMKLLSLRM